MKFATRSWIGVLFLLSLSRQLVGAEPASSVTLNAADYGAIPDDGKDDTAALQRLFADGARQPNSIVCLAPGRYDVSAGATDAAPLPIFSIQRARGFTLEGRGALLAVSGLARLFDFKEATGVALRGFTVDWVTRPAAGIRVEAITGGVATVKLETPGPVMSERLLEAFYFYDEAQRRPAATAAQCYWLERDQGPRLQPIGDGGYTLPLQGYPSPLSALGLKVGDRAVIRFAVYRANAFAFNACERVALSDITILAAPGMGIVGLGSTDLDLTRITVKPAPGQWISTCADATHFTDCRGTVTLRDCEFEAMGDDALNLQADLLRVRAVETGNTLVLERGKTSGLAFVSRPRAADEIAFASAATPLAFAGSVTVRQIELVDPSTVRVTFSSAMPATIKVGDTAVDLTATAGLNADGVKVKRNHGRGFLVQTPRRVHITDCRFEQPSGSAIQFTSDVGQWWEGPPVRDAQVTHCYFDGGNDGPSRHRGMVSIFADGATDQVVESVHAGIAIMESTFMRYASPAIYVSSAHGVAIKRNKFYGEGRPILRDHASEVELQGNERLAAQP